MTVTDRLARQADEAEAQGSIYLDLAYHLAVALPEGNDRFGIVAEERRRLMRVADELFADAQEIRGRIEAVA